MLPSMPAIFIFVTTCDNRCQSVTFVSKINKVSLSHLIDQHDTRRRLLTACAHFEGGYSYF